MYRVLEFTLLFVVMILLQVFMFSRMGISVYINPLVYIAFIILLPMEIAGAFLLLLAALCGMCLDLFMGSAGLYTISTLFAAFCRPFILNILAGKDEVKDGGIPDEYRLGRKKFLYYMGIIILLNNIVFFSLETLSWQYFHIVLLRILLSSVVTFVLVYCVQKLFRVNKSKI